MKNELIESMLQLVESKQRMNSLSREERQRLLELGMMIINRTDLKMNDPIFKQGFDSTENKNPYKFPEALSSKRMTIALKDGPLNNEEKIELKKMNEEIDNDPWSKWSSGYHARKYEYLRGLKNEE